MPAPRWAGAQREIQLRFQSQELVEWADEGPCSSLSQPEPQAALSCPSIHPGPTAHEDLSPLLCSIPPQTTSLFTSAPARRVEPT